MTNTQDAKEKVCLIDGSGYIFRAFFASPQMTNPEGLPVNAVYGFLNIVFKPDRQHQMRLLPRAV